MFLTDAPYTLAPLAGTNTNYGGPVSTGLPFALVVVGDSHSSINEPWHTSVGAALAGDARFKPFDRATQVFATPGAQTGGILATKYLDALAYMEANKTLYRFIPVILLGTNNFRLNVSPQAWESASADLQIMVQGLSKAAGGSGRTVMILCPPDQQNLPGDPTQDAVAEANRQNLNNDIIANYATKYGARAAVDFSSDVQLYPHDARDNYPGNFADATHYSDAGNARLGTNWVLPVVSAVADLVPAAWPAPTALTVDVPGRAFTFNKAANVPLPLHEYTIDSAATITAVASKPIGLADGTYATAAIRSRVAAYGGNQASDWVQTTQAYTIATATTPSGFEDAVLRAFSGTPTITGNSWAASQAGYADAVESTKGFNGSGTLRLPLIGSHRDTFHGLSQAGLSPTQANIAINTTIGALGVERFYVFSFNGQQGNTTGYRYVSTDVLLIERIDASNGTRTARIRREDGAQIGLYNGSDPPIAFVDYIDVAGCFNDNLPLRYLAVGVTATAGGDGIQLKSAGLSAF